MNGKTIQLTQISIEEFCTFIKEAVSSELKKLGSLTAPNPKNDSMDLLTREQASKMLNVSYTTLFHWNNDSILPAHKIGRKVFYLRQEVIDKLNNAA